MAGFEVDNSPGEVESGKRHIHFYLLAQCMYNTIRTLLEMYK